MISEEMLSSWEDALQWSDTNDWDDVITVLIDEVRQLKKEADWLAKRLTYNKCPPSQMPSMCVVGTTVTDNSDCIKCWREEAKNEVHKQL